MKYNAHLKSYYHYEYLKRLKDDDTNIFPRDTPTENPKICIIGAGAAGLFSALLLKEAGIKDITILEYQDRIGGRVRTHYFTNDPDDERRLYGELGAMRLPYVEGRPDLSPHQLMFDTIDYLNDYNKDDQKKQIHTIPFIFSDSNAIQYFNNKKDHNGNMMTKNYYATVEISQLGYPDTIPSNFLDLWNEALMPFFDVLNTDFTKGLKMLKRYDEHSTYSYLRQVFLPERLPNEKAEVYDEIISAIELQLFVLSFVDMAIASYTFDNLKYPLTWKTIDKGLQRFPNAFLPLIKKEKMDLRYNSEVYKLENTNNGEKVKVYWKSKGKKEFEVFDRVIVTPPLGVVRHWDLPSTLSYGKRRAIRELNYAASGKIFLQFKSRFWETNGQPTTSGAGIVGGTSSTDLPVRTVVYPSYYQGIPPNNSAVLLASYTWKKDAEKYGPFSEEEMFELALKDIVTLHGDIALKEWIPGKENNKAIYWPNDKTAGGGAFAEFGPAQFGELMESMMKSEDYIHWAGEHTDIFHAWIVGALNSGVRVVREVLLKNLMKDR
ncbi:12934_t:CDS:2 [Funneliformis mosseae]|uniref:12934_t:CDS:1 n=1 Tax=Funneliformis mosseae TaxID=27381 RepID=A0A9N9E887_FUNMO|nr:12934_t:CDS:2 [Funneliformis mosseae]